MSIYSIIFPSWAAEGTPPPCVGESHAQFRNQSGINCSTLSVVEILAKLSPGNHSTTDSSCHKKSPGLQSGWSTMWLGGIQPMATHSITSQPKETHQHCCATASKIQGLLSHSIGHKLRFYYHPKLSPGGQIY